MNDPVSKSSVTSISKRKMLCWSFAAILFVYGSLMIAGSVVRSDLVISHSGILLNASESGGRIGNNTTLSIQTNDGTIERHRVHSTLRVSAVSEIRERARRHRGTSVVYKTVDAKRGRLISVETVDGTMIVSAGHTRAATQFSGWSALVFAAILGLVGFYPAPSRRSA